ncbi:MAG: ABC transporter substrate-binding protein [Anaerolineae bacterium]|jgi:alpha-glucoside transport system substrate-binding protein
MKRQLMPATALGLATMLLGTLVAGLAHQRVSAGPPLRRTGASSQGVTLTIMGTMAEPQVQPLLNDFSTQTGFATTYEQNQDRSRLRSCEIEGTCPDVAIVPWPELLDELGGDGTLVDLGTFISTTVLSDNYSATWIDYGKANGTLYGVWFDANNKSLVWYDPGEFSSHGWTTPTNWTELLSLSDEMLSTTATAPWSIGNESGSATGWPLTDWFEDILLRSAGPDVYDALANHSIPWTHTEVVSAMTYFGDIFGNEAYQLGGQSGTLSTNFWDAILPPFEDPPSAYLHRQASFAQVAISGEFPGQVAGIDYAVFPFPNIDPTWNNAVMGGGNLAMAFNADEGTQALINYLITARAAELWIQEGNVSPNRGADLSLYPDPNTRAAAERLVNADIFRFDLTDQLPSELNVYVWRQMDDLVRAAPDEEAMMAVLQRIEWKASGTLHQVYLPLAVR